MNDTPQLPHDWEVALVDGGVRVQDTELDGLALVVEADTGDVRAFAIAEKGQGTQALSTAVATAAFEPHAACSPGRPRRILVRDAHTRDKLKRTLRTTGIPVAISTSLPALDEAALSLVGFSTGLRAPGITTMHAAFAEGFRKLYAAQPWAQLSDEIRFRFNCAHAELNGAVAVVLGHTEDARGILLYPDQSALEQCLAVWEHNPSARDEMRFISMVFEPADQITPEERAACADLDMVLPGPRYPCLSVFEGGDFRNPNEDEQAMLLMAIEALADTLWNHIDDLASGSDCDHTAVVTSGMPVKVVADHDDEDSVDEVPFLFYGEITNHFGRMHVHHDDVVEGYVGDRNEGGCVDMPALFLKMRKKEALVAAQNSTVIKRITVEDAPQVGFVYFLACDDHGTPEFTIAAMTRSPPILEWMAAQPSHLMFCVSAGGPRRNTLRVQDFLVSRQIPLIQGGDRHVASARLRF